jgi:1-acyl-sn-glycerol-3-phosphate acyltransferase
MSALLWSAGVSWLVPMMTTMMAVGAVVPPHRTEWLSRLYCRGQVAMTGATWRAVVDPGVDPARPYLFASNHVNLLDHVTMYCATPHFKQGLELESHFSIPVYGWFMRQRGTIPVKKGLSPESQIAALRESFRAEVDRGHSLPGRDGRPVQEGRVLRGPRPRAAHRPRRRHRHVRRAAGREQPHAPGSRGHRVL